MLFSRLYMSWCHSLLATISLCFLTQNYSHTVLFSCLNKSCCHSPVATMSLCFLKQNFSHLQNYFCFRRAASYFRSCTSLGVTVQWLQYPSASSHRTSVMLQNYFCFQESYVLFLCLYKSWYHSAVATISLCFLTQSYSHNSKLLLFSGELRVIFMPVQVLVSQSSGNNISLLPHTELQSRFKITAYFVSFKTFQLHLKFFYSSMFSPDCDISKSLKKGLP